MKLRRGGGDKKPKLKSPDDRATLVEHLAELRTRIIRSFLAIVVGMLIVLTFYDPLLHWLTKPYRAMCAAHADRCVGGVGMLLNTDPIAGFTTRMRVAGWGGFILALPVVLWQVWKFVTPGLHDKEKKYALPFVVSAVTLFLFGAAVAYITLRPALDFLSAWAGEGVASSFTPQAYIRLATLMMLAFGAGFLFPIFLVFLEIVGVLTPKKLSSWRRQAIVIIVVAAAVITPSGDPYSLAAMAIPMYVFFEASIVIGWFINRRKAKNAAKASAGGAAPEVA